MATSAAAHAALLAALFLGVSAPPATPDLAPIDVNLIQPPLPKPAAPTAQAPAPHVEAAAPRSNIHRTPAPPDIVPLPVAPTEPKPIPNFGSGLADAQSSSAGAGLGEGEGDGGGGGGPGGACDMARRLQSALRKDPLVQAAIAHAGRVGEAIMVWDGDWVQSQSEDGKGLAAVREAIMWEIAFAPKACRVQAMRGRVLLSANEGPGEVRLAVGEGSWRWSDLLKSSERASGYQ